jgi:hypothetical protein
MLAGGVPGSQATLLRLLLTACSGPLQRPVMPLLALSHPGHSRLATSPLLAVRNPRSSRGASGLEFLRGAVPAV